MLNYLEKLSFIIGKRVKGKIFFLILLLFIGMFFEIIGLSALLPVLSLIANPEGIESVPFLNRFSLIQTLSYNNLVLVLLLGIFGVYLIKTIFLSYLSFRQNRFLANVLATISNNLFSVYLNQTYDYHTKNNSSKLVKNLQTEVHLVGAFNFAAITIFVELGLLLSILVTLIVIEPLGAISVGVFLGLLVFLFYRISRIKLLRWGKEREGHDSLLTKTAIEGLSAIKEIKLLNVEKFFAFRFEKSNYTKSRVTSNSNTVAQLPRYYLELISVIGLVLFIISMLYQDKNIPELIATIGVFVAAVFRLMPSLNKILTGFQNLKYYSPAVDVIYNEFVQSENVSKEDKGRSKIFLNDKIQIENLSFGYDSDKKTILNDISLEIKKGEMIGIIGNSGSGKSSLIDLISGFFKPSKGSIKVDGEDIFQNLNSWRKNIGYVSQDIYLIDDSIENNIAFGISEDKINNDQIQNALRRSQLETFVKGLPNGVQTQVGEKGVQISGGQKQRIGLSRALYHDPEVLFLDEATSALDEKTELAIMESIYLLKNKKTIIIVAHRHSTLKHCDRIFEISNNRLIEKQI